MCEVFSVMDETEQDGGYDALMNNPEETAERLSFSEEYQDWWVENVVEKVADIYWSFKYVIEKVREMEVQAS